MALINRPTQTNRFPSKTFHLHAFADKSIFLAVAPHKGMRKAVKYGLALGMKSRRVAASVPSNTKRLLYFSSTSNPTGERSGVRTYTYWQLFLADSTYEEYTRILNGHDSARCIHAN